MSKILVLTCVHALASLFGVWLITLWTSSGTYALGKSDAQMILVAAPIAGALASLVFSQFIHYRQVDGSNFAPWLRVVLVSFVIALAVSVVISSLVAIDGLISYHDYMASKYANYEFDQTHAAGSILFINAIGAVLSAFTVLPANLLVGCAWLIFAGKKQSPTVLSDEQGDYRY